MDVEAYKAILSRLLPKTGQSICYQAGDDGTYEAGWWKGKLNLGNKVRFISKTVGSDVIVIDRATGLIWAADGNASGCKSDADSFSDCIIYAEGLTFAGFSDWRVPNIKELVSLLDYGISGLRIKQPPFSNTTTERRYVSSTTYIEATTYCYGVDFIDGKIYSGVKTDNVWVLRCVRGGL